MQQLSHLLFQRVRASLERYAAFSYELSDSDYADCDVNDPFALAASASIEAFLEPIEPFLAGGVLNVFMAQLAESTARMLEEFTFKKRFSAVCAASSAKGSLF